MIRSMATIFLFNGDKLLMLKRSPEKKFNPNVWSVIGGHVESDEWKNPLKTALREMFEEISFKESDLTEISLRYILIRKVECEIRIQYVFVARTNKYEFKNSIEGELYWVSENEILTKNMTVTIYNSLKHYLENSDSNDITLGIFDKDGNVLWSKI